MHVPSGKRVLIVDDEESIGNLLSDFFSINGYEPVVASNGSKALDTLKEISCSLMIVDVNMPETDGIKLIGRVRNLSAPVKIIGMSFENKINDSLKAGADYFLFKPFNLRYLRAILNSMLE
jgi:DNA-binding response OmpR family regulator